MTMGQRNLTPIPSCFSWAGPSSKEKMITLNSAATERSKSHFSKIGKKVWMDIKITRRWVKQVTNISRSMNQWLNDGSYTVFQSNRETAYKSKSPRTVHEVEN